MSGQQELLDAKATEKAKRLMENLGTQFGPSVQLVRTEHSDQSFWDSAVLCVANRADMTASGAAQFADELLALRRERIGAAK